MPKRWTAVTRCSCLPAVLWLLVLPRCILSIRADNTFSKDDVVSATVNATVLDSKGNPKLILTKDDGKYGQNSPKVDAKGIVIAPAPYNGGRLVMTRYALVYQLVAVEWLLQRSTGNM